MFDNDKNAVTFLPQIKLEVTSSFNRTQNYFNDGHEPTIGFFLMDEEKKVKFFVLKRGILKNFLLKKKIKKKSLMCPLSSVESFICKEKYMHTRLTQNLMNLSHV